MKRMPLASPASPAKNATSEIESNKEKIPKIFLQESFEV
jgi:hypothetical protein